MKRIVACLLTLILCVMAVIPANATVNFSGDISRQSAPELVQLDETGSIGIFQDEEGEEVGKITPEDLSLITLKEAQEAEEPTAEEAALLDAYGKLSDEEMLLSTQAPFLNAIAAERLGQGHTADDLVVSELFVLSVLGEENQETMGAEGTTLSVTFQMNVSENAVLVAMAYTAEGWQPLELQNNGDGTVTCTLTETAVPVALLVPNGSGNGGQQLTDPSASGAFVPSISAKAAPELLADSEGVLGWLVDVDGNRLSKVLNSCLVVTPVSDAYTSKAIAPEDAKLLLEVYDRLCLPETKLSAEAPAMNAVAQELLGEGHTADDFVIRDLFDISFICEEHRGVLPQNGVTLDLKFVVRLPSDAVITAMAYVDGEWMPVETVNNGDETVTCHFKALCPVAFLTSTEESSIPSDGDGDGTIPQETGSVPGTDAEDQEPEGSNTLLWGLIGVAAAAVLALLIFLLLRKKKKAKV